MQNAPPEKGQDIYIDVKGRWSKLGTILTVGKNGEYVYLNHKGQRVQGKVRNKNLNRRVAARDSQKMDTYVAANSASLLRGVKL